MSSEFIPLVQNVWRHRIEGTSLYAVTRKLRALKPQLLEIDRHNTLLLCLEKCCKLIFFKAAKLEQGHASTTSQDPMVKRGGSMLSDILRKVAMRRASKRVFQIINEDGHALTTQEDVVNEFVSFYQRLLGGDRRREFIDLRYLRPWARHVLTQEESQALVQSVSREEIKDAFFGIAEDKAPGPDGYSSDSIKQLGRLWYGLHPRFLIFRPISCCNVLYKVITKIIVQRLRLVLDKLISPSQNAFVPGRSIAQELFTGYNTQGLPMRCALKVDLRKAYDTVEWDFLSAVLQMFGFPGTFMNEGFSFHWRCKELGLFQLCFADDLLLFCKADVDSGDLDTGWTIRQTVHLGKMDCSYSIAA
ncbi:hypothetical protein Sango_3065200 [Sesamum angolense]|uniref:Reverse transcriptase domain-containing protein n=1 Tax=Sesamum angolense TaxID=2727404 RepID=A0AAE1TB93_9LAMI|nr:hypothetical protein Sango_3065200 [Sesamum angolense]